MEPLSINWRVILQTIAAGAGATVGFLWGDWSGLMIALITFIAFDYLTGVLNAIKRKKLSSEIGFKGLLKKIGILLCVAVGHILDAYVLKQGSVLTAAVQLFFIANEGISILENLGRLGVKYPQKLKDVLQALKKEDSKKDD